MSKNRTEQRKKIFGDKSYRKKYKYYYTLTFLIPIMVILLANTFTQNTIKNQLIQSNEKTLTQFFRLVDENMEVMLDDAFSIVMKRELTQYAQLNERQTVVEYPQKVRILELLGSYCVSGSYDDVFVWFPNNDRVLSGVNPITSSVNLQNYSQSYYPQGLPIQAVIEELKTCDVTMPVIWPIAYENGERLFCISLNRYRFDSKLSNYTVTLVASNDFLNSAIHNGVLSPQENAMLFNKDGELLFSYQKEELNRLPEQYRSSGIYEIWENGRALTLLVHESECMDGYYAMVLSHEDFYQPLTKIRLVSVCGILLSIAVGIFVVYQMSRNTYRPLELVMGQLQDNAARQFDSKEQSEFDYLVDFLNEQEKNKNADKLQKQKRIATEKWESLLLASLEGVELNDSDKDFLEHQTAMSKYFYGGILQITDCGEIGWKLISFAISNVFQELLGEQYKCDILSVSSTRYVIILRSETEKPEEYLTASLQTGISFLKKKLGVNAFFGMADNWQDLYGLRKMYRQAQHALEYHFLLSEELIIRYRDISQRKLTAVYFESNILFHVVIDFLQREDLKEEQVTEFLMRLLKQYEVHQNSAIESVDYFRFEMLNVLNRIWAGKELESFKRQRYVEELMEAENLTCYTAKLTQVLYETGIDMWENSHRIMLAVKIKKYVEGHYSDPNLNVMMIGDAFSMQGAYLSQIFREEYGMLLSNYISHTRVNYAKGLLRETDATVFEISQMTGFLSSSVFIKTFKKIVGVTPGKYKEANLEKNGY